MLKKILYTTLYIGMIVFVVGCSSEEPATNNVQVEQNTPVEVMEITKGPIIKTDVYSGQVQPNQKVVVNTNSSGEVVKVNFDIGDKVSKGDILFIMDNRDILNQEASTQSQLTSAIATFDYAEENLENMRILYDEGAVSKQQYDQTKTAYEQAKASKELLEIQLRNAKEDLEDTVVRSPIDGIVSERNIQAGEMLGVGLQPFTILSVDTVYVDVSVPETLINRIRTKKEVEVRVEAAQEKPFKGTIARMSPISDQTTHTYPIRIEIRNEQQKIKPGMFAEAVFEIEKRESVVIVPRTALVKSGEQWHAFIVEENIARKVPLQIGLDEGITLEVKEGLKEGQKLIIKGKEYVSDGEIVKIVNK